MLNRLSAKYQKEIALSLMAVFMISGLGALKAQALSAVYRASGIHSLRTSRFSGSNGATGFRLSNRPPAAAAIPATKPVNDAAIKPAAIQAVLSGSLQEKPGPDKADIGGPSQPEMTAFKSVGSDNMVSPFTGDFSYNIPLLDVGGYPVNMFYSSGISMDQEASWVGLGWNINPGTITRNMRGLPDDFNGSDKITKTESFREDSTFGLTTGANVKLFGFPTLGVGASWGLSWNNKLGVAAEAGVNASLTLASLNTSKKTYSLSANAALNASSRGGASVSPSIKLEEIKRYGLGGSRNASIGTGFNYSSRMGLSSMHLDMNLSYSGVYNGDDFTANAASHSGTLSFAYPSVVPSVTKPFTRENYSLELSGGGEMFGMNGHVKLRGYYNHTYLAGDDKISMHPAYGMLHLQDGEGNKDALLDFNRANDGVYTPNTPTVAMPVYTYDVFSINGEGTGGSFRAYRGDVGHMRDPYVKTKDDAFGLGVDLGFGNMLHVGADLNYAYSPTDAGDWITNNMAASAFSFQKSEGKYQSVYFKNPGEKTVPDADFQAAMSGEELVRFKLANTATPNPMLLPKLMRYDATKNFLGEKTVTAENTKKINRDKRTQVISFLTAEEAERIGMQKRLYSYASQGAYANKIIYSVNCNKAGVDSFYRTHDISRSQHEPLSLGGETKPFRRNHHISEIDVLGTDGKKYVYGIPVYNKKQVNVTFSIDASQKISDAKAEYLTGDDTEGNIRGRDWMLEKEEIPPYTHSYLLTELVSPNYVDVTGNGISEDDMGDAVKFNYSKYEDYKWRTPVNNPGVTEASASYSAGLKTDEKDDKAHYVYGEREQWYLYSVESKNMVARFYVKSDRKDGRPVEDDKGVLDTDLSHGMKRLEKIALFSKGDLSKYGDNAKPIKTIRFFQSYKLCKNTPASSDLGANIEYGQGKLTLDSIWVLYNGITRKPKSRYVFYYPDNNNPDYHFNRSDGWGTYKPSADNPNTNLTNEEFPYSTQDQVKADKNAAAWALNKVLLPSGAVINIDYESDTYAYVQNKKAATMCQVLGFGNSAASLPSSGELNKLYSNLGQENTHVYLQLPVAITGTGDDGKREFAAKYLEDIKQLYLKIAVTMPVGSGLSGIAGEETIPVYADIADYGLISPAVAWVRVKDIANGHTPMVQTALQFLMKQLPGKAYKGYDLSDENGLKPIITAMGGMLNSIGTLFSGELNALKMEKKCQKVVLYKSFVKLTNPSRNKFGGGHRVKRITISDNWDKMTGQLKSTYGQEYRYTTTEVINEKQEVISSGVATWEPAITGDENPNRDIMRFMDHNKGGPYDYGTVEMPLGEMFYPSPMVGYSRVEVVSIHRDTVKNSPTRQVTEFYTTKDFPYKSSCTDLTGDANARYEPAKIMQLLQIDMMKGIAQSQGFLVETNDMNGKEKSVSVFASNDPVNPVSYTENFYNIRKTTDKTYGFNHDFPVIKNSDGKLSTAVIGRDIEVMTDFREHHSETYTANLSINFDGFIIGFFPIPFTNLLQPVVREGTMYRSAAILKLVTHYGILDSVVSIDKGSMVSTKNLVYDAETGNPLLTRTQNEHNKPVYNFSYPAHWVYSGMGPAYRNIDAVYTNLEFRHGILTNPPAQIFDNLESGDEIYVVVKNQKDLPVLLPCDDKIDKNNPWDTLVQNKANRIWAVNTSKTGAGNGGWVFMDEKGLPYNATFNDQIKKEGGADIRIVRSGKRNLLDQAVATVTSMNDPRVAGKLTFNDATGILQTTAATFKDHWRVENSWFRVKESVDSFAYARVKRIDKIPDDFLTVQSYIDRNGFYNATEKNAFLHLLKHTGRRKHNEVNDRKLSFLLYPSLTAGELFKATLSIYSHTNSLFPSPPYPAVTHQGVHSASSSYNSWYPGTGNMNWLGQVHGLKGAWFASNDANAWVNSYLSTNSNVSYGMGIIPYSFTGSENYTTPHNSLNVTLPYLTSKIGGVLINQNKFGLRIRLANDNEPSSEAAWQTDRYTNRCFWSPQAMGPCGQMDKNSTPPATPPPTPGCSFATPVLSYYYYNWGDSLKATYPVEFASDPSWNLLLTKYIKRVTASYCKSVFDQKAMNPYVEGVLGNWRADSTYAYYGERRESDFALPMDTRIAGTIKNYKSFWNFATTPPDDNTVVYMSRNQQAADAWVWNSAVTQFNRKGYEIENTDPLGRFNAGLYGYNQQLPVAVANNARVREIMFDGFEDYDYSTGNDCISCKPHKPFAYNTAVVPDATQKHTGRYSMRINAGQSVAIQAPVVSLAVADEGYGIKIQNSTTSYTNQALGAGGTAGTGLKSSWYNHAVANNQAVTGVLEPATSAVYPQAALIYTETSSMPGLAYNNSGTSPKPGVSPNFFSVKWEGKLQAPVSGTYRFRVNGDNGFRLKVNGIQLSSSSYWDGRVSGSFSDGGGLMLNSDEVVLVAGQVYPVEISYFNQLTAYNLEIKWQYKQTGATQYMMPYTAIPVQHLYAPTATSFKEVITVQQTCYRLDTCQVTGNALTDTFSLIKSKRMLISAWVKVGTANCCFPATYDNGSNSITISYNGSSVTESPLKPTGSIIEGWQRYERDFVLPDNATGVTVSFNNTGSQPVYFDDIRIHPFNSNMKSFVYHGSNLRLMAELDENNYSSLYEYDDDGTLTRTKKETQQGVKTITETRSATQKQINE